MYEFTSLSKTCVFNVLIFICFFFVFREEPAIKEEPPFYFFQKKNQK